MDNPDLQAILSSLARYAAPPQPQNAAPNIVVAESLPLPDRSAAVSLSQPQADIPEDPRLRPQSRSAATASPKPVIDPATITTWQEGIRCVTKIAAQNAQFAASIRKVRLPPLRLSEPMKLINVFAQMIEDQRKHELRWYSERQALQHTQAKRTSSAAQAQSILQSLSATPSTADRDSEAGVDNEAELAVFDRRIYDAQQKMEVAVIAELKGLGVPFFGTDRSLVVADALENTSDQALGNRPKWSPTISETQLLELRRRMVQHLEDLYKD